MEKHQPPISTSTSDMLIMELEGLPIFTNLLPPKNLPPPIPMFRCHIFAKTNCKCYASYIIFKAIDDFQSEIDGNEVVSGRKGNFGEANGSLAKYGSYRWLAEDTLRCQYL